MTKGKERVTKPPRTTAPPMTFHAPEIVQRKRRASNATATGAKRNTDGKQFRNLSHQNNARKKMAAEYEQQPSTSVPTSTLVEPSKVSAPIANEANEANPETNDSWLFFSDDDTGGPRGSKGERRSKPGSIQVSEQSTTSPREKRNETDIVKPEETLLQEQEMLRAIPMQVQKDPQPLKPRIDAGKESASIQNGTPQIQPQPQPEPKDNEASRVNESSSRIVSVEKDVPKIGLQDQSVSNTTQDVTIRKDDPAQATTSGEVSGVYPTPTTTKTEPVRRNSLFNPPAPVITSVTDQTTNPAAPTPTLGYRSAQQPPRIEEQRPEWQPRTIQSAAPIHPSRENVLRGDIVRAGGREWVKGDLVVEIYLRAQKAGKVKIQGAPWAQNTQIVRLKPKNEHNLPVNFDRIISYPEYLTLQKVTDWWSAYCVAAVETFSDSDDQISSLAEYLEGNDLGVVSTIIPRVVLTDRLVVLVPSGSED